RAGGDAQLPPTLRALSEAEGLCSTIAAPIANDHQTLGVFSIGYRTPHRFTTEEQRVVQSLAQRAGLAIQNARLFEQAQHVAAVEERQRLARELHDAVTQSLFAASLIAEVIPRAWEKNQGEAREHLQELRLLTRG